MGSAAKKQILSALDGGDVTLLKAKPHRNVYHLSAATLPAVEPCAIVVKRFVPKKFRHRLRAMFSPFPLAAREYWISRYMLRRDIPTARPLLWASDLLRTQSIFAAEALPSRETLEATLSQLEDAGQRAHILKEYARLIARVHYFGLYLGDAGFHNVLVDCSTDSVLLWLVDHERCKPLLGYIRHWRLKDLSSVLQGQDGQELVSGQEQDLFYRHYQGAYCNYSKATTSKAVSGS